MADLRHFDPISLRLFVTVCEERNIAAAAAREAIVPSAVSKRISAIEQHTGTRLLDRGRRGVVVTPAGETLWRYARELLQTVERMHAELGEFAQGVQGNVRVFATMSAIAQFLPDDISAFIKKQQRVKVSIDERVSSEVVRGVEEGRADIGVCWDAADLRRLASYPYRRDQLCGSPSAACAGAPPVGRLRGDDRLRACRHRGRQHHPGGPAAPCRGRRQDDALPHPGLDRRCGVPHRRGQSRGRDRAARGRRRVSEAAGLKIVPLENPGRGERS